VELYWVTTEDHAKDWFIAANTASEAIFYHAAIYWYKHDSVKAEKVMEIPENINLHVGWPSMNELIICGGIIIVDTFPRVVKFNDRIFFERPET
jgi:hypothetical protein